MDSENHWGKTIQISIWKKKVWLSVLGNILTAELLSPATYRKTQNGLWNVDSRQGGSSGEALTFDAMR
jgi:hypothetical protein